MDVRSPCGGKAAQAQEIGAGTQILLHGCQIAVRKHHHHLLPLADPHLLHRKRTTPRPAHRHPNPSSWMSNRSAETSPPSSPTRRPPSTAPKADNSSPCPQAEELSSWKASPSVERQTEHPKSCPTMSET